MSKHYTAENWDSIKNKFIKLGGTINNLTCRNSEKGRGVFIEGDRHKAQIICPKNLLIKVENATLVDGKFHLKKESDHLPEEKEFLENYYQNFSWGESGKEESAKFLKEIRQIPKEAKTFCLNNGLCTNRFLNCEIDANFIFQDFINRRYVKYLNKSVLAPIWELVNHSSFTRSFKTSNRGVETAPNPDDRTTNEILHAYTLKKSPIYMFFHYGFASNEVFAYSFPTETNLSDGIITIRVKGSQAGIESTKRISFKEHCLEIPSLPIGSISGKLPVNFFYSIAQKYGISESKSSGLILKLQLYNLLQRKKIINELGADPNETTKIMIESFRKEISLIENSLNAT